MHQIGQEIQRYGVFRRERPDPLAAQGRVPFRHLSIADGLSQGAISSIVRASAAMAGSASRGRERLLEVLDTLPRGARAFN